jgi:60 kDa SS-A/Ro ribonucleoprotein
MSTYTAQFHGHLNPPPAPVSEPLPGREADMVVNNAGAYTFSLGHNDRLLRFLVLGADGATYYATKDAHFKQAYTNVEAAIKALGPVAVECIAEVSEKGRAPKQDAAIFALALAAARGDTATRSAAIAAIPRVCRIPTHLFSFLTDYKALGGKTGGRAMKTALQRWYLDKPVASVAYAMVKYRQRGGWTHRDVLRLCKPAAGATPHGEVFAWATGKPIAHTAEHLRIVAAYETAKDETLRDENIAEIIRSSNLPREAIPDTRLKSAVVWRALLYAGGGMPMTALVRNLNRMTASGMFDGSFNATEVCQRLTDAGELRAARIHPIAILSALRTYAKGCGERGSLTWTPHLRIVDALESAFVLSFDTAQTTGKRFYVGLDVSSSMMSGEIAGVPGLTPREASAALAMLWAKTEPSSIVKGFTSNGGGGWYSGGTGLTDLTRDFQTLTLRAVQERVNGMPFGSTQPALIIEDAINNRIPVDVFIVLTDNEVNSGAHPADALRRYREATGIPARLIVVGMTATEFTLADPNDPLMLDMVGFDTAAPAAVAAFVGA